MERLNKLLSSLILAAGMVVSETGIPVQCTGTVDSYLSGLVKSEKDAESASLSEGSLSWIRDLKDLDPEAAPYVPGGLYMIRNKQGTVSFLNSYGEVINDEFTKILLFELSSADKTDPFFLYWIDDKEAGMCNIRDEEIIIYRDVQGYGGVMVNDVWNPETSEVLTYNHQNSCFEPLDFETYGKIKSQYEDNIIHLLARYEEGQQDMVELSKTPAVTKDPWYVLDVCSEKVYDPVDFSKIWPWDSEVDAIDYFNPKLDFVTVFPAQIGAGLLICQGKEYGPFSKIELTSTGSAFVKEGEKPFLFTGDGQKYALPDEASFCSGLNVDSLLILENGIWKLYGMNPNPTAASGQQKGIRIQQVEKGIAGRKIPDGGKDFGRVIERKFRRWQE